MSKIAVIGAGPVGLATADQLSKAGKEVVLVCPRGNVTQPGGRIPIRETYQAAAAFWTPFSSGLSSAEEMNLSSVTLDFYKRLRDETVPTTGVVWRIIEQYWQEGNLVGLPAWRALKDIHFQPTPYGDAYLGPVAGIRWRCEFSYSAPVVDVDVFRAWYLGELETRANVKVQRDWIYPLASDDSGERKQSGDQAWAKLISDEDISTLVVCTGSGSSYFGMADTLRLPAGTITFKKGIVAHIPASPEPSERVLDYEGSFFESKTLYLVPHHKGYVLGGTVESASPTYHDADWQATDEEKNGVLERAEKFLPDSHKEKLAAAGLWSKPMEWRVGVRPKLSSGPRFEVAPTLARQLGTRFGRPLSAFMHFGHGGSGFTFCQDTASKIVAQIL